MLLPQGSPAELLPDNIFVVGGQDSAIDAGAALSMLAEGTGRPRDQPGLAPSPNPHPVLKIEL